MRGETDGRIRFEILGPMRVSEGAEPGPVAGPRQRIVLAALLERANRPLSAARLAETVWDGRPPDGAVPTLRSYVMRLRRGLGPQAAARILTMDNGYVAQVADHELDALLFEARCRLADAAARVGDWAQALAAAENALSLWRGAPLADVPCQTLHELWLPRLEQSRLHALERHAEAGLNLGRGEQLIQPLRELTAAHPLRERFHAQLMLALYRTGRQAEALEAYQQARRVLVESLGIEPGAELRSVHARILAGETESAAPRPGAGTGPADDPTVSIAPVAPPEKPVPRQLPAAARHFTGRQAELDLLADQLGPASQTAEAGATVVVSAIDGMAGIGKTTLAIHAAHRLAGRYPDGQLFLDLHGYTRGHRPRTAGEALDWLLRSLGVPPAQIPADGEQAAALYRQRLAGTRTLIVLDNAATEAQVRPLLPGAGRCLVLVTSRRRLKSLDDARIVALDLLPADGAVALLRAVAGPDRIAAADPLAGEVAELCGFLPLALRIAASLLRHRPSWPLEYLAGQLRDQRSRVAALSDGERELAAVFDLSYASLDERHRYLWRSLGLIPGSDLDAYAAAALVQGDPSSTAGLLEDLVDHNLLAAYAPGRYRLHDLMRVHAQTLAAADPAPDREAAQGRLLHYYAYTAQSASVPIARYLRPEPDGPAPAHLPPLADQEAARTWLRTEQPNLEAAFTDARARGLDRPATALAAGLAEILQADGPFTRALEIHQSAAETAERAGPAAAYAAALTDLGRVRHLNGDYPQAVKDLTLALEIHCDLGNRLGEATALTDLGRVRHMTGDYPGAIDAHTRALEIYRTLGNRRGEAVTLADLGRVRHMTGDFPAAIEALTRALEIYRALGHRLGEATALTDLGRARHMTGDYPEAIDAHTRALAIHRTLGSRLGEAGALTELGRARQTTGDFPGAEHALAQALEIYRALGHRLGEATALTRLGRVRQMTADFPGAEHALTQALDLYRALGSRLGAAGALTGLGRVRQMTGDFPGAEDALTRALEIYRALGNRSNEACALNYYAAALAATDRRPRALALYRQALAMNRELNKPDDEAVSLEGIADHHLAAGDTVQGIAHLHQALEIYRRLGMTPDTRRVQAQLGRLTER